MWLSILLLVRCCNFCQWAVAAADVFVPISFVVDAVDALDVVSVEVLLLLFISYCLTYTAVGRVLF